MYRDTTAEIQRMLSLHVNQCHSHIFVGQSTKSSGETGSKTKNSTNNTLNSTNLMNLEETYNVGMTQKEQQKVIAEFKQGKFNTLIATSIGEEGLDIGEVDMIICFDASASPIKVVSSKRNKTSFNRD